MEPEHGESAADRRFDRAEIILQFLHLSNLLYEKSETMPLGGGVGGGASGGAGGRRALELLLGSGLRSLARPRAGTPPPQAPVRRAASRDSVLTQPQPLLEGTMRAGFTRCMRGAVAVANIAFYDHRRAVSKRLRKCSTVLALTERSQGPIRPHNRLRAPSVCSRCSSLLSLAGGGSRYSLDGVAGFVPAAPILCKLCLEDTPPDKITVITDCGCSFCTKHNESLSAAPTPVMAESGPISVRVILYPLINIFGLK
ncbi:hypothetical protein EVAR_10402_1 [Eumeta japonica]|uniref:Uncharacterized protein n=1 Tax=Eumeta variegata TaxID=151549 RepID=A0A4C1UCS5_EUMVA|nr:hypothetical protein EVAR_10402_1 [Eumeta japonica]